MGAANNRLDELLVKAKDDVITMAEKKELIDILNAVKPSIAKRSLCICPYHDEHTPSFSIDRDTKKFHCFSCGVNGLLVADN